MIVGDLESILQQQTYKQRLLNLTIWLNSLKNSTQSKGPFTSTIMNRKWKVWCQKIRNSDRMLEFLSDSTPDLKDSWKKLVLFYSLKDNTSESVSIRNSRENFWSTIYSRWLKLRSVSVIAITDCRLGFPVEELRHSSGKRSLAHISVHYHQICSGNNRFNSW